MSQNIVVLSGSPRKGGNTDGLVAAFIKGAESASKNAVSFRVADMKINGCMGCGHCVFQEKGVCIQKDDMHEIMNALLKADALVLASPIYFYNVTAQLKIAIDRMCSLGDNPPIKRAVMLMTCGDESETAAESAIVMHKRVCDYFAWETAGILVATKVFMPGDIEGHEVLDKAKVLGQEV